MTNSRLANDGPGGLSHCGTGLLACLLLQAGLGAQTSEFVAERMPTPSCHASTIVELRSGELMAAWFGGEAEGRPDVAIWGARRQNGHWSAPAELVREPNIATWNPVLFRSGDGVLWLYYKFGPGPQQWTAGRMSSRDDGATWSSPEHLPAGVDSETVSGTGHRLL